MNSNPAGGEAKENQGRRPRIGIDLHVVDDLFQGSRTHCLELFSRVIALTPECDFVVVADAPERLKSFSRSFSLENVQAVKMPKKSSASRLLFQLPAIVKRFEISLLHTQYIAPIFPHCATAVTVHDILFESHREYFEKLFILRSRLLVPRSVRHSAEVFTVSDFSRRQICETYGVAPDKVHTILNGIDHMRFFPGDTGRELVESYGLKSGDYFLTVGRQEPRKNHAALLRAWARILSPRPRLVVVGQRHFQYREPLELIRTLGLEQEVIILDQVSDAELPAIYRNAKGFLYASRAEGFGIPLLEAMASGVPVISSANTALTEVGGDAALWIDPDSPDGFADAIRKLEHDEKLRERMIQRGLSRSREFMWEDAARTVRGVYLRHFGISPHEGFEQFATDSELRETGS